MNVSINIPFEAFKKAISGLSQNELLDLQKEIELKLQIDEKIQIQQSKAFKEALLNGPTFSKETIKEIKKNRERVNSWHKVV